jgi:hypothetical protein
MQEKKYQIIIAMLAIVLIGGGVYFNMKFAAQNTKQDEEQKTEAVQTLNKGLDNVYIQVRIKEKTSEGEFNDSLYYTPEEWQKTTAEDVKKAAQKRADNWVTLIKGAPVQ